MCLSCGKHRRWHQSWWAGLGLTPVAVCGHHAGAFTRDSFSSLGPGSSLLSMSSSGGERPHVGMRARDGNAGAMGSWAQQQHPGPAAPRASQGSRQLSAGSGQPSAGSGGQQPQPPAPPAERSSGEGRLSAATSPPADAAASKEPDQAVRSGSAARRGNSGSELQQPPPEAARGASLAGSVTLHPEDSAPRQEARQAAPQPEAVAGDKGPRSA